MSCSVLLHTVHLKADVICCLRPSGCCCAALELPSRIITSHHITGGVVVVAVHRRVDCGQVNEATHPPLDGDQYHEGSQDRSPAGQGPPQHCKATGAHIDPVGPCEQQQQQQQQQRGGSSSKKKLLVHFAPQCDAPLQQQSLAAVGSR